MHRPATRRTPARGSRRRALARLACAALAGLGVGAPAQAAAWDLAALMRLLAARGSGEASFDQTKTLAMLDAPIESSGTLRYAPPDYLEMRTLKPRPEKVVVQGARITVEVDGHSRRFDLDQAPAVGALVGGIRATLGGDLGALQRAYRVSLGGDEALWTLALVPRLPAARERVSEIDISGSGAWLRSIAIFEADGDHSLMRLHRLRQR